MIKRTRRLRQHLPHRRLLLRVLAGVFLVLFAVEAYRAYGFYRDVSASKASLLAVKRDLDVMNLHDPEADVLAKREHLVDASVRLQRASRFVSTDPIIFLTGPLPVVGAQTRGAKALILAAEEASQTGLRATDVALAFSRYERDPNRTSIEQAMGFLKDQEEPMHNVEAGLRRLQARRDAVPQDRLLGPLASARSDLHNAVTKLDGLVGGYNRANALLPDLLGYNGKKRYLVLPQNDTELFPSGGLISSYSVANFDGGKLVSMDLEYFGTLYDRWQRNSHNEYIEPPGPLKQYLKRSYSWALGEAGWYPDFPTTSDLARMFVAKGGVPPTDGTIAIDLQFMSGLLNLLGPVPVPEYGVTVTPENVDELTLEQTRDEGYVPGGQRKAFLSYLSRGVMNKLFTAPKEQWVDLLKLLDRMAAERHLQLHFEDPKLQAVATEYGLDGALKRPEGDFLLIADTSVNSTKLNLILDTKARIDLQLFADGSARSLVTYEIHNPFPAWKAGKNPGLVRSLMFDGVYGSYLRVYAPEQSKLEEVRLAGKVAGAEQSSIELGKAVFGRFFPVLPDKTENVQFLYQTPGVVTKEADGYHYHLYVQKEAGQNATPLNVGFVLPKGARLKHVTLDGKSVKGATIRTDLRTDRQIEIVFTLP